MVDHEDNWDEPEREYDDEHRACHHGITPRSDCDWCREQDE